MEKMFSELSDSIELGVLKNFKRMSVIPLSMNKTPKLNYITLDEALHQGSVAFSERGSGTVPEIKLVNESDLNILMLDGEELEGANQNRVINTTIVAIAKSSLDIPVSCTEQGRWSEDSRWFRSSGRVMPKTARASKNKGISQSLRSNKSFRSDQQKVWSDIDNLFHRTRTDSYTRAMKSAMDSKEKELQAYTNAFSWKKGQSGIVVFVDGKLSGLEMCSRPEAFAAVMPKLIASYSFDAIVSTNQPETTKPDIGDYHRFMDAMQRCQHETYDSIGLGNDIRFEDITISGTSLVYKNEVVHLAAYAKAL